ncbi:hypothetical protein C8A05DRAFT_20261 [Staphylotrichum tortipilum]|uniref:Rhodopsin domain-containing protein n=1 Tax=Staphylotrichum tortipilum TaxID=2831512 RepID=A0AAN6M902_9PEZI|nr:hypothetical protein C8A05DRAFT_20261 [Staphylotrichum longicolle]
MTALRATASTLFDGHARVIGGIARLHGDNLTVAPPLVEPYPGWADEDKRPMILSVAGALIALAFLFVVARIYCRLISIRKLRLDDFIVIFCIVMAIAYFTLTVLSTSYGLGKHMATLSPDNFRQALMFMLISFEPGILLFATPKFAVVILLFQILHPGPRHTIVLWVVSVAFAIMMVGNLVVNLARCTPAAALWGAAKGVCWDRRVAIDYSIVFSVFSAVFDFYLALYPTIVMCRRMMNWRKKLALSSALGFGYCAAGIGAYKAYALSVPPLNLVDFTYEFATIVLWTTIEGTCVLIGACIPCLYPLAKKIFGERALGNAGPNQPPSATLVTIGGTPTRAKQKHAAALLCVSGIHTFDDIEGVEHWHYITLEDRAAYHTDGAELWAEDTVAELELQQRRVGRGRTPATDTGGTGNVLGNVDEPTREVGWLGALDRGQVVSKAPQAGESGRDLLERRAGFGVEVELTKPNLCDLQTAGAPEAIQAGPTEARQAGTTRQVVASSGCDGRRNAGAWMWEKSGASKDV